MKIDGVSRTGQYVRLQMGLSAEILRFVALQGIRYAQSTMVPHSRASRWPLAMRTGQIWTGVHVSVVRFSLT